MLVPTEDGTGTIVSWRRGSPDSVLFSHYQIQRTDSIFADGLTVNVATITESTETDYTVSNTATGIASGIGYNYRVLEVYTEDGADHTHTGTSDITSKWIHFIDDTVNNQVDNLRSEVLDGGARIRLTWDEPTVTAPIDNYGIFPAGGGGIDSVNADTRSYTFPSPVFPAPSPGIYNQYRVRVNFSGSSGPGSLISVLTPPVIPNNVEVVLGADGEFTVNWDPPLGATEYKIERGSVTP